MKFNFKKISAVVTGVLLTGMTMGVAVSAANFPAQFTSSPAIVYGTNAQPGTDLVQAKNIQTYLENNGVSSGASQVVTTVNTNESYKFEKASTKFHLGDDLTSIRSSLTKTQLPKLLADGTYRDQKNNANQYTQKITLSSNNLTLYDKDSNQDPTIGFDVNDGTSILTYTLNLQDNPEWSNVDGSWLPFMGKNYYVLSHYNGTASSTTDGTLTLLNFASNEVYVNDGASKTVNVNGKAYTVKATFIGTNKAVLEVNGETLNSLSENENYELNDGSYIVVKDILASSKTGSVNQVGFVIGSDKLKIGAGNNVEVNGVSEAGLTSTITKTSASATAPIKSISLTWSANNEQFVTENSSLTMPVFKTLSLSYTGLTDENGATFGVENSGSDKAILNNFPFFDGATNVNLMYIDTTGNYTGLGESATRPLMVTTGDTLTLNMSASHYPKFIASYNDGSGSESSYIMKFSTPVTATGGDTATLSYNDGSGWKTQTGIKTGEEVDIGDVSFNVTSVNATTKVVNLDKSAFANVEFNNLYSAKGLTVHLPWVNGTALNVSSSTEYADANAAAASFSSFGTYSLGYDGNITYNESGSEVSGSASYYPKTSYELNFTEADKDGNANMPAGKEFSVTFGDTTSPYKVTATTVSGSSAEVEMGSNSQKYVSYVYGPHATKLVRNTNPSQNTVDVTYNGGEVTAGVYLGATATSSTTSTGNSTTAGNMIFKDSETSSYANMNVIVVGGSCINQAAATLLGVSSGTCGSAFTTATGIGSGQYLIKGYGNATGVGKSAILVAGYNADDTKNAVTYLTNNAVDTSKDYKGTSATEATVVTTTA